MGDKMNQRDKDLEVARLYKARANGEVIQRKKESTKLEESYSYSLRKDCVLKATDFIKPKTRAINGYEVPDCLHKEPNTEYIFLEDLAVSSLVIKIDLKHSTGFDSTYERGILHATKEGAIASCKARLGIDPYSNNEVKG